jgi:hypothetical protein
MRSIIETAFPAKYLVNGSMRYVTVPAGVAERMALKEGDYLDVVIKRPKLGEWPEGGEPE